MIIEATQGGTKAPLMAAVMSEARSMTLAVCSKIALESLLERGNVQVS